MIFDKQAIEFQPRLKALVNCPDARVDGDGTIMIDASSECFKNVMAPKAVAPRQVAKVPCSKCSRAKRGKK